MAMRVNWYIISKVEYQVLPEAVLGWKTAEQLEEVMTRMVKNKAGIAKNIPAEFFRSFYAMKLKEQIQRRM